MLVVVDGDGKGRKGDSDSDSGTSPEGHKSTGPAHWTDPASLIALKATGCDCRKHGYKHIHDLCIADAAKVRPHIVPLVEALLATQWGFEFRRCPVCAGWNVGPNGETDYAHTNDCIVRRALNPEE